MEVVGGSEGSMKVLEGVLLRIEGSIGLTLGLEDDEPELTIEGILRSRTGSSDPT